MKNRLISMAARSCVATIALCGSIHAMADCFPVKGKIFNTLHNPPVGGVSTIGVVALNGGTEFGKLKCALVGVWAGPGAGAEMPFVGVLPNFTHTISCDDEIPSPFGTVHSQLTFDTSGTYTGFDYTSTFSFTEHSVPAGGSGTGAFTNVAGGYLDIEGTLNAASGSVDMSFTGEVCK